MVALDDLTSCVLLSPEEVDLLVRVDDVLADRVAISCGDDDQFIGEGSVAGADRIEDAPICELVWPGKEIGAGGAAESGMGETTLGTVLGLALRGVHDRLGTGGAGGGGVDWVRPIRES